MRKSWPYYLAVITIGALAGIAVAGRPSSSDPFTIDPAIAAAATTSTTKVPSTTVAAVTTIADDPTDPTDAPTTTTKSTTTTAGTATTDAAGATALDRAGVRLVLANGVGRSGLATSNADLLRSLGYTSIELSDVDQRPATTLLFYRPGFEEEALTLRADLGTTAALIAVLPNEAVTGIDSQGDIVVVLGPDAQN